MISQPISYLTVAARAMTWANIAILSFVKRTQPCNIFLLCSALLTISVLDISAAAGSGACAAAETEKYGGQKYNGQKYVEKAARGCAPLRLGVGSSSQMRSERLAGPDTIVSDTATVGGGDSVVGADGVRIEISSIKPTQPNKEAKPIKETQESKESVVAKELPGLYFACERKLALKGKRISASDWLGRTSKDLSYGDRGAANDTLYSEEELFKRLSAEMESSGRPLTIFVHGCCVSFNENLIQANDIHQALQAQGLNGPLLAYDWATPNYNYAGSLARLPGCRTNFTAFLQRLVSKIGRDKIVIVAHSLGIHALQEYCQHTLKQETASPQQMFSAVVLCRPDVDVSSFKHSQEAIKMYSGKLMLLCATNDINLKLSSFIRRAGYNFGDDPKPRQGNHLRLGQASVAGPLAANLAVYDISKLKLKHLIPYKLIASLLTGECSDFTIEKAESGVLNVKSR